MAARFEDSPQGDMVKRIYSKIVCVWFLSGLLGLACAQGFPNKPIQVIVPVAAGGGTDLLARTLGQKVGEELGQNLIVENRLGAGGNIGVEMVARAKPDGYTLLVSPATIATNVAVYNKLPYDLLKDLQTVTLIGQTGVCWWYILRSKPTPCASLWTWPKHIPVN